ncbi:ANP1/MMN9/VAN1 family protein [Aspergillus clavatus NRRL 1]|uniref:N-glycosyl-transferase n=1 Tax=Aspergillus clavatus (strain ATCC 1007 / CBS 513.65 / DSM 816 / NCTC 3887 / NRRL 1 / QM 1276 / 107) TaxID=344612 RepID=A1CGZ5_ASPCL|nr:N-glycosyl-transferase [Aspergillus clavatus NRRL 1]EAW10150.1 N-glycosyl-transferase [Aspergillus clavatus NRRL 1]
MLLPKGGVTWKSARARLPPWRAVVVLTRPRFLISLALTGILILLWRGISKSASGMQSFYCYGPSKSPMEMSINEMVAWNAHTQTPVTFNHHEPYSVNESTIHNIDLNPIQSTPQAVEKKERVLILTPLRDAAYHLPNYFNLLHNLTYPHDLIDLAFLVGDSSDETLSLLSSELTRIQSQTEDKVAFRSATIIQKEFNADTGMNIEDRHAFASQGPRRKAIARARNYLLYSALKPEHSWVYWRDVDISDSPPTILEDFIVHNRDILVPNIWFHRYKDGRDIEGRFDYNSWIESDKGRRLRQTLDPNTILAEGYAEYDTGRQYLVSMGDWRNDKDKEVELDGIGGVNILVKADVHRSGINFPPYAFENQAETEGFARMAKRAGYEVYGLPNYIVWHVDTEEKPGNLGDRKAY